MNKFLNWIDDNFDQDTLRDISRRGADRGGHALTYPHRIRECFNRFSDDIFDYLSDVSDWHDCHTSDLIGKWDSLNEFYTAVVWRALVAYATEWTNSLHGDDEGIE
jgi:hypothetical protein